MAIDPRDYAKYSGRSGDPMTRQGAALAGAAKQKQSIAEARSKNTLGHAILAGYKFRLIAGGLLAAAALLLMAIRGL